jgi:hypothetical protein
LQPAELYAFGILTLAGLVALHLSVMGINAKSFDVARLWRINKPTLKEVIDNKKAIDHRGQLEVTGATLRSVTGDLIRASGLWDWCPATIADH